MKINDEYKVKIIDEDNIGNGVSRIDNFVVFIKGALESEEILIKITDIKKHYAVGKIIKIISKNTKRKENICSAFNECGGCSFLHINYNEEENKKINEINKILNVDIKSIQSNNEYNYRNKATFHIKNGIIGYYKEESNDIVEFENCSLLDNRINDIYNYFKNIDLKNITQIMVRTSNNDIMVCITSNNDTFNYKNLLNNFKITSLYLNNSLIFGKEFIIESIDNIKYSIYPKSFFQVNSENMILLYDTIKTYSGIGNKLLDLYCGTGSIGIYLHDNFKEVIGIEINESSIKNANINLELNSIKNVKFVLGDSKEAKKDNYDVIIVDPPRSGLSSFVTNYLNTSDTNKIIYVSCNHSTLKRDINLLTNYELKSCTVINMFNKTKHLETVVKLEKVSE